ncbi:MAG: NUDIX hydrolase [Candidatus Bathyarchaeota archaeon B63]|nr:MAG: NUDIX hydrolase [Candidatus Bathyarchaeota archaeon B63]
MSETIINRIKKSLKPFSRGLGANAAVAIILKQESRGLSVLLVKRAENPHDPWSGQIALPGGKRMLEDRDLKETVVREIHEETGIDLTGRCEFLGVTRTLRSRLNPEIKVLPFVFLLRYEPKIQLNEAELERHHWIPIDELVRNESAVDLESGTRPAFIIGDVKIWGLTFRILRGFMQEISKGTS